MFPPIRNWLDRTTRQLEPEAMADPGDARVYDRVARAHAFLDRMLVRDVLRLGPGRGLALDVGCGSGIVPILLSAAAPGLTVIGLDLSDAMLRIARQNAVGDTARAVGFARGNGKLLPFSDATFDLVLSHHTLHHLSDPLPMIFEMQRVLKPGGALFIRDLRRPGHVASLAFFAACGGCLYSRLGPDGAMAKKLYRDSLKAAFSRGEWRSRAAECGMRPSCVSTRWLWNHQDMRWWRVVV